MIEEPMDWERLKIKVEYIKRMAANVAGGGKKKMKKGKYEPDEPECQTIG